ncbi:tryptophan dimethylallyltransferase-domain-containing protein [Mycena haematopus]|nr:tryptophan dimethylallyltransferase-domain-containing protein [Mycena haematopus]
MDHPPAELCGRSSSYMADDSTPIEFSWAVGADGTQTVRFTMEPLSPVDGTLTAESTWVFALQSLAPFARSDGFDLTWSKICLQTLVQKSTEKKFTGCDLTRTYFLPHIRSKCTGISPSGLVATCMLNLGLGTTWAPVHEFIRTLSPDLEARPEIVSVNSKVYLRTNTSSLAKISEIMTLGHTLIDPVVVDTIHALGRLWRLLFPNIGDTTNIPSRNNLHYASGFVIYFKMSLESPLPLPKVYIPIVADTISSYFINSAEESATVENIKSLLPQSSHEHLSTHRSLDKCTGIYTYVGCAARKSGPQLSLYLSPETFAPERKVG